MKVAVTKLPSSKISLIKQSTVGEKMYATSSKLVL